MKYPKETIIFNSLLSINIVSQLPKKTNKYIILGQETIVIIIMDICIYIERY